MVDFIFHCFRMDLAGKKATHHAPHGHHCHGLNGCLISVKVQSFYTGGQSLSTKNAFRRFAAFAMSSEKQCAHGIITEFVLAIQSVQLNIGYSSRNLFPAYRHSLICCQLSSAGSGIDSSRSANLSHRCLASVVWLPPLEHSGAIFTEKSIKGWIEIWERENIC